MIIDSHAHYASARYEGEFPYLDGQNGTYTVGRAHRDALLGRMKEAGIAGVIEPGIGFDNLEQQLALAEEQAGYLWAAIGVHPTRCIHTPWSRFGQVARFAETRHPIAIGETGLDYHYPRLKQHRLRQKRWFIQQIRLADCLHLPLILHIREADEDALKILNKHRSRLHGGVVHCFGGNAELARKYVALGFSLGIGGKLLWNDAQGLALQETVRSMPITCLLVETDAPYVLPDLPEDLTASKKQRRKLCNSSLLLPMLIRRISELRGETAEAVEDAIFQNTVAAFHLDADAVRTRREADAHA